MRALQKASVAVQESLWRVGDLFGGFPTLVKRLDDLVSLLPFYGPHHKWHAAGSGHPLAQASVHTGSIRGCTEQGGNGRGQEGRLGPGKGDKLSNRSEYRIQSPFLASICLHRAA